MNGSESGNACDILNDVCGSVNDDDIVIDVGNGDITVELDERQMELEYNASDVARSDSQSTSGGHGQGEGVLSFGRGRGGGRGRGRGRGCGCGRGHYRGGVSSNNGGVNSEENVGVCNTNEENIHVEPYVSSAGPRVSVGDILQLLRPPVFDTETNRYARLCRERAGEEHTWGNYRRRNYGLPGFHNIDGTEPASLHI